MDYSLVHKIVRDHFQKENSSALLLKYSKRFNTYFQESCSHADIKAFSYEHSVDGIMELLKHVTQHLLSTYGLHVYTKNSWKQYRTYVYSFKQFQNVDSLTLTK